MPPGACACRNAGLRRIARDAEPAQEELVLAIFPFTSPDPYGSGRNKDGNAAGRRFADHLRLRAMRLGLVVVEPLSLGEAMAGLRPGAAGLRPGEAGAAPATLQTPPAEMAAILKDRLAARFGLWRTPCPERRGMTLIPRRTEL